MGNKPLIYIIAGEASGDALGARLMRGVHLQSDVEFAGIGGELMCAEGLKSLFPMQELSVMGLMEIIPHLRNILKRVSETVSHVEQLKPDMIITIDSPGFAHAFIKKLKSHDIPRVHYVAPTVWAWKPKRVHKFKRHFDMLLTLLPFEPPYFEAVGLKSQFVGHSVLESGADQGDGVRFRKDLEIPSDQLCLCLLPGSRKGEVSRHMEIFKDSVRALQQKQGKDIYTIIPTLPHLLGLLEPFMQDWPGPYHLLSDQSKKFDAMAACDIALAASGTVALELAMAKLPCVVAYRINPLTAAIAKRMIKVNYVHLLNILENKAIVPERLMKDCRADILAEDLNELLGDAGRAQINELQTALDKLKPISGEPPSFVAAREILKLLSCK